MTKIPNTFKGFKSVWKDGKSFRQINFGYSNDQNLFLIEAKIGKRNPKITKMVLSPTATIALFELMTKVIFPNQK